MQDANPWDGLSRIVKSNVLHGLTQINEADRVSFFKNHPNKVFNYFIQILKDQCKKAMKNLTSLSSDESLKRAREQSDIN